MHELAITEGIIEAAVPEAQRHGARKILEIRLKIGELSGVLPECIQEYFNIASRGTIAEGARLAVERIPITIHCESCGDSRTEVIPATGHKTVYHPDTEATCTENGYTAHYRCEGCGNFYIDAAAIYAVPESYLVTKALGHKYGFKNNGDNHSIICENCDFNIFFLCCFHTCNNSVYCGFILTKKALVHSC